MSSLESKFLLDNPIILSKDTDILGHTNIVDRLKGAIKVHKNEYFPFVIGLEGEWGTWKTTILSTLENDINHSTELEDCIVFNYSPWLYGSDQDLYTKFFEEFWIFLEKNNFFDKDFSIKNLKNYEKAVSGLDPLSNNFLGISAQWLLSLFYLVKNPIIVIFLTVRIIYLVVIGIFSFENFDRDLSYFWTTQFIFNDLSSGLLILTFIIWLISIIKSYANSWDDLINSLKKTINKHLKENNKKIIFIIDDIDRLPKEKISIIMQLVKSIANFNNVIYILSYDKKIVENALKEEYNSDHYLDKIVQVRVPIPIIPNFTVAEFALTQLRQFIQNNAQRYGIDDIQSIQYNLHFLSSFFRGLKTVRDVKRFINLFQIDFEMFHSNLISQYSSVSAKKKLDFDFNEFVLIELVKFSNREFYDRIYRNIWFILSQERWILWEDRDATEILEQRLNKFLEQNPLEFASDFIGKLFPINKYWQTGKGTISISNKDKFKSYFIFEKSPVLWEGLFHTVLECMIHSTDDSKDFAKEVLLEQWWRFFDKLDEVIQKSDNNKWGSFDLIEIFSFLIVNHDIIQIEDVGRFTRSSWERISRGIYRLFERLSDDVSLYLLSFNRLLSVKWWLFFMLDYARLSILYSPNLDWWTVASSRVKENRKFKEKIGNENIKKLEKKLKTKIQHIINTRQLLAELGWQNILKYEMILGWKTKRTLIRDLKRNDAVREFFDTMVVSHLKRNENISDHVSSNDVRGSATHYFSDTALKDILNQYYKNIEPEIYKKIRSILFSS